MIHSQEVTERAGALAAQLPSKTSTQVLNSLVKPEGLMAPGGGEGGTRLLCPPDCMWSSTTLHTVTQSPTPGTICSQLYLLRRLGVDWG